MIRPPIYGLITWLIALLFRIMAGTPRHVTSHPTRDEEVLWVEAHQGEGCFEVQVLVPEIDPTRDVVLTASRNRLLIEVRRIPRTGSKGQPGSRYGSVDRWVSLPDDANPVDITTTYDGDVLFICVPLSGAAHAIEHPMSLPVTY